MVSLNFHFQSHTHPPSVRVFLGMRRLKYIPGTEKRASVHPHTHTQTLNQGENARSEKRNAFRSRDSPLSFGVKSVWAEIIFWVGILNGCLNEVDSVAVVVCGVNQ